MVIVYNILHYLAYDDTIECVRSILKSTKDSIHITKIVVVDNGSDNNSYNILKSLFNNNCRVTVIRSEENLGFARGNNIGFKYAKSVLKADFIVQLNNDTLIRQDSFNEILVRKFEEKKYYVLGPDIITADGYHQNPGSKQSWGLNELRVYRLKKRIRILLNYFYLDRLIEKIISNTKNIYRKETVRGDVENTILHGACMIFSPLYIKEFDGLCDKTFLYMEEDILKLYADYYGFLMLYSGDLQIYHKEDAATNMAITSERTRMRRKYHEEIRSSLVYSKIKREMQKQVFDFHERMS